MPSSPDLTSLASVKTWLTISGNTDDGLLAALITAASQAALDYIGRPWLGVTTYTEDYTTYQYSSLTLRQYPVQSVTAIYLDNAVVSNVAAGFPPSSGFLLEPANMNRPQKITLFGFMFPIGDYGTRVTYTAGYAVSGEAQTISAANSNAVTVNQVWFSDLGVTFAASGLSLTLVTGTPAAGQYSVANGVYTFAAADTGKGVLISYSAPPAPVEMAVKEMVGEAYRRRERIGQTQRTHPGNGGSVSTPFIDLTPTAKMMLSSYRRAMPV